MLIMSTLSFIVVLIFILSVSTRVFLRPSCEHLKKVIWAAESVYLNAVYLSKVNVPPLGMYSQEVALDRCKTQCQGPHKASSDKHMDNVCIRIHTYSGLYSCFASLACFARARLRVSFKSECVYDSTTLGGANPMTAPISAWVQYGVMVPGAILASTTRTKAFGVGTKSDARRIFDIVEVCEKNGGKKIIVC
jgi:hypothetical protein